MKQDSFKRPIDVGDIVLWTRDWRRDICVIRGFGKNDNPHFAIVNDVGSRYNAHGISNLNTVFKLDPNWLYEIPDQVHINEVRKLQRDILNKLYEQPTNK